MAGGFDIGKLTGRIELEDYFSGTLDLLNFKIEKVDSKLGGFGSRVAETATGFLTAQAAAHAFSEGISLVTDFVTDLAMRGAEVSDVTDNFDHLTEAAGRLGETLLNELREGTHSTIDDFELIKIANQDLAAGMKLTDDQFRTLADGAFALAQATGVDVKQALDTMNDAMLTGRTRSLAMLTGKIDLTAAEEKYAKTLGISSDKLTEEGKLQASRVAILEAVGAATKRLGEQTDGVDEMVAQAVAAWRNFRDELGKSIAESPALLEGLKAIGDELKAAFGGSQESLIKSIVKGIEDLAISAIDMAKVVSDSVGIAARTWYGFRTILDDVIQGYRVLSIAAEETALVIAKITGDSMGVRIATKALDELYASLAKTAQEQEDFAKSADAWSVSTGKVNEALDRIKTRMLAAREAADANKSSTDGLAASTGNFAAANDHAGESMKMTAEEAKKMAAAMQELNGAGKDYKQTILDLDGAVVEAIKYYLQAGVSQSALATAYGLTAQQVAAVAKATDIEKKATEDATKAALEKAEALKLLQAFGQDWFKTLQGISGKLISQAQEYLRLGASAETVGKALGLTDAQMKGIQKSMEDTVKPTNALADAMRQNLGDAVAEVAQKVRTLSGDLISIEDFQKRQTAGGSTEVTKANLAQNLSYWKVPESVGIELAKKGLSFQEIIDAFRSGHVGDWVAKGPRIPGFKEGGVGDFGAGTLAVLHGKEIITPWDKAMDMMRGGGGGVNLTFYVNGTGEQVARVVKDQIMNELSLRRQLPVRGY